MHRPANGIQQLADWVIERVFVSLMIFDIRKEFLSPVVVARFVFLRQLREMFVQELFQRHA